MLCIAENTPAAMARPPQSRLAPLPGGDKFLRPMHTSAFRRQSTCNKNRPRTRSPDARRLFRDRELSLLFTSLYIFGVIPLSVFIFAVQNY
jgi:hypothetical protein